MLTAAFLLFVPMASAGGQEFDSRPWLEDLEQVRAAVAAKYANLDWSVFERETDLPALFADTAKRVTAATSEAEARAAFERMARRMGDGHVGFHWPGAKSNNAPAAPVADCVALGYDARQAGAPLASLASGYVPLADAPAFEFPAGMISVGGHKVGVVRIGLFSPNAFPELCTASLPALNIASGSVCDESCSDRIETWTSARLTDHFAAQLRALKAAGADVLLVDVTSNGGGSEWAEAAVRMVTAVKLKSARMGFVRGAHWVRSFAKHERELRDAANAAAPEDRELLNGLAEEMDRYRREAESQCDSAPIWRREKPACEWVLKGFYAAGLVAAPDMPRLQDKKWASLVFEPVKFNYEEGVWQGPLIVLVDGNTWSAAEEFAAELQDNRAAVIVGAPTGGAGCGHTDGGTPTTLNNSGGVFDLPDCVRFRADGSNEVMGIQPDVLVGLRADDGPHRRALRLAGKLDEAVARAIAGVK
jgi:hypothetical protein